MLSCNCGLLSSTCLCLPTSLWILWAGNETCLLEQYRIAGCGSNKWTWTPTKQLGQASDGPSNQMSHLVVWLQGMWWGNTWVTCEGKASPPPCLVFCYSFFVRKILINCVCNSFALILVVKIWGRGGTSSRLWQTLVLETTAAPTRKDKLTHSVTPPNDVPTVSCLAPLFLMTTHLPQGSKSIFWCITRKSN